MNRLQTLINEGTVTAYGDKFLIWFDGNKSRVLTDNEVSLLVSIKTAEEAGN